MAVNYAVLVFNRLPRLDTGVCPIKVWSQLRTAHGYFRHNHVVGFPVYVLEPKLQDGRKISKMGSTGLPWDVCWFLFCPFFFCCIGIERPHYQDYAAISRDLWQRVQNSYVSSPSGSLDQYWQRLFKLNREFYLNIKNNTEGNLKTSHLPDLDQDWLDPDGSAAHDKIGRQACDFRRRHIRQL